MKHLEIQLAGEAFYLLPQKAMFRPAGKQLILSDVHLGKATHFRKNGIPLPAQSHVRDFENLNHLMEAWNPEMVLILGDLFHSDYNREWLLFETFLKKYPTVSFLLIEGNHDILKDEMYSADNLQKLKILQENHIVFSHHPLENTTGLNICGHIHPGIHLSGKARQSVRLACFYSSGTHFILPAFGHLTGLQTLKMEEDVCYYLVLPDEVRKL